MFTRVLIVAAALLAASSMGLTHAETFQKSRAIVVGINDYKLSRQWPTLKSAVPDAQRIGAALKAQGYEVTILIGQDASRAGIVDALRNAARQLGKDDRLLFYFGGHGYTEKVDKAEYGYLVPWDGDSPGSLISMEEVRGASERMANVRHQLFILNACYGGLIGMVRGFQSLDPKIPDYIAAITRRDARQFITAGGADQQVLDGGPGDLSPFAHAFLEAVEGGEADANRDGYITFSELSGYLLPRATTAYQTPATGVLPKHAGGEYVFAKMDSPAPAPSPPPKPVTPPAQLTTRAADLPLVQANFGEMQAPIDALYAAWDGLDLDRYLSQWAPNAVQYVGKKPRRFSELKAQRVRLFQQLAQVSVERYQLAYRGYRDGMAHFDASYTMTFRYKSGRVLRETERESYKVGQIGGKWLIVENRDYQR